MKFFVYGRLKSDERKSWMIPFAYSRSIRLRRFRVVRRPPPNQAAALIQGGMDDYIDGEIRKVNWTEWPIVGRFLGWLLLKFLDLNEGTYWGVYKRQIIMDDVWIYIYNQPIGEDWEVITEWHEHGASNA